VDSKMGAATGAVGALAGGLEAAGFEGAAAGLSGVAIATDTLSGAGGILALALESQAGAFLLAKVQAVGHAVATAATTTATTVATGAQWLLNAALTANPIGLVVVALALLAGGLVLAYQKSETFREIVSGAFGVVKDAVDAVWKAIQTAIGWVEDLASAGWAKIQSVAESALGPVQDAVGLVSDAFSTAVGWVQDLISWIGKIDFPSPPAWVEDLFGRGAATDGFGGFEAGPGGAWGDKWGNSAVPNNPPVVYQFTIQGAIDPVSTARQIKRIMAEGAALNGSPDWATL
jgi:hypothetical protein